MAATDITRLFEMLAEAGWTWRDGAMFAPHGSMWLDGQEPWSGDLRSFHERMINRVARLRGNLERLTGADAADIERAVLDATGLVEVLGILRGGG